MDNNNNKEEGFHPIDLDGLVLNNTHSIGDDANNSDTNSDNGTRQYYKTNNMSRIQVLLEIINSLSNNQKLLVKALILMALPFSICIYVILSK